MSIRENLHNYYEKLVAEVLEARYADPDTDLDYLADIACVALNRLPPRYFRHEIDMAFYLSPAEYTEMRDKVQRAVEEAKEYVDKSLRDAAAAELAREEELRRSAEAAARAREEANEAMKKDAITEAPDEAHAPHPPAADEPS